MFRPRLRALAQASRPSTFTAFTAPTPASTQAVRQLHTPPKSRHNPQVGVPGLLSPQGYELAWTKQMKATLGKLNDLVVGTDYETRELKKIIIDTARVPAQASVFNHASMAHNTDFFFKQLISPSNGAATPVGPREIPLQLRQAIEDNFGSVETLRREFAAVAEGMFGPGFVWLVKANGLHQSGRGGDNLRLLTTYLAGSPYPGAHYRRQAVDMNTVGEEAADNSGATGMAKQWLNQQGHAITSSTPNPLNGVTPVSTDRRPPGGIDVIPLLCVSTWEHVWLRDYGLGPAESEQESAEPSAGGKAAFIEAWWDVIDWDAVSDLAKLNRPSLVT